MNRLAHWMMRLYPARWRRRYGDELDALLTDTGADARIVADLLKGGIRMQFSTWSFAKLAAVLGIGGLLLGAAGSFLIPPIYRSSATLQVDHATEMIRQLDPLVLSRSSLAGIIQDAVPLPSPHWRVLLYEDQLKVRPLEDVIADMRSDIRIDPVVLPGDSGKSTSAVTVSFQYPDAAKAPHTVAALIRRFEVESDQWQLTHTQSAGEHSIEVVDTASLPVDPTFPHRYAERAGCALVLITALAWRGFRRKKLLSWWFAASIIPLAFVGAILGDVAVLDYDNGRGTLIGAPYRSTAIVSIENRTPEQMQALEADVLSQTSLASLFVDPRLHLYPNQWSTTVGNDVIETIRQHLTITPDASGHYFTVAFVYKDRYKAQQTVQAIMNRFDTENNRLYGGVSNTPTTPIEWGKLAILTAPSTPILPVSPNRYKIAGETGLVGLAAAAIIALVRRRWKPEPEFPLDAVNG